MQINNSPRFIKNFTLGLVASSLGAFIALPSTAMPEPGENLAATEEVMEDSTVEAVDELPTPSAEETLPSPTEALEADAAEDDDAEIATEEPSEIEALEADAETTIDSTIEAGVEAIDDTVEAGVEAVDSTVEAGIEALDGTVEADAEMVDETVEADAEMTDDMVEADAEIVDETVEADAEMTEDTVEADVELVDDTVVESETEDAVETVEAEINTEEFTIAELTDSSESFTILTAALAAADLTEVLSEEGPYTVFAPTDEAFEALPDGAIEQLLLPENKDVLIQILTYHVVPGAVLSTDLETGGVTTVEGSEVAVDVEDAVTIDNANVILADVKASNGVIHIIDRVIVPPMPAADADVDSQEAM